MAARWRLLAAWRDSHPAGSLRGCPCRSERYYAAAAECYPQDLDGWLRRLRGNDREAIEDVVRWLEADYFTRWTGYIRQKVLFALCQASLTDEDRERLQAVVLHVCTRGPRTEFREVRRLARRQLATAEFAAELRSLAASTNRRTTRDAALMVAEAVESGLQAAARTRRAAATTSLLRR